MLHSAPPPQSSSLDITTTTSTTDDDERQQQQETKGKKITTTIINGASMKYNNKKLKKAAGEEEEEICCPFGFRHIIGVTAAIYSSVAFMLAVYFFALLVFDYEELWFDIALFVASAIVGQLVGWRCAREEKKKKGFMSWFTTTCVASILLLIAIVCCFPLFTEITPQIPLIFQDASNKSAPAFYGRPKVCGQ